MTSRTFLLHAALAGAAWLVTPVLHAEPLSEPDKAFLQQAARNGMTEVEGGKLAVQRASSAHVKQFAQHMVDDHTKANAELKRLATAKGVELPTEPSVRQQAEVKLLERKKDGADFDDTFAKRMGVKAHKQTIALFQKGERQASDPDVKAYAARTLPQLKEHLQMAEQLHGGAGKAR